MKKSINEILSLIKINRHRPTTVTNESLPYDIEVIAENINIPWAIAINDEGKLYFTERSGTIHLIENGKLKSQPLIKFTAPFISRGEGGLLGLVLDPNFQDNRYLYAYHTYIEGTQLFNRVVMLKEEDNILTIDKVLIDKIPGGQIHNGGRLKIGPDQKLYITTGDAGNAKSAQDLNSLAGKILRLNLDGSIPDDNPFTGSPIFSYGHRNPQGLAWGTNHMYASEHGQSTHDEINIIKPGANYGWPLVQGYETSDNIEIPMIQSDQTTWAPSGIAYINQGPWQGKLLVASLRGEQLLAMTFNEDGTKIVNTASFFKPEFGRLREVIEANDGSIYLATNNMDGRGSPKPGDDKIIRLVPRKSNI